MRRIKLAFLSLAALAIVSLSLSTPLRVARAQKSGDGGAGSPIIYPPTKKGDKVDDYFGTKVPDPYRWLEDDNAPDVKAWVEAQNKVTFAYLDAISYRPQIRKRLETLLNYPRYGFPTRRGEMFIFSKNDGLQNQNVYYIQKGLDGTPDLLLDPNKFSADGTSQLGGWGPSETGKYIAYGISEGGSDWRDYYVLDVATRKPLADHIEWVKFSGASWVGDEGFFYNRYPQPESGKKMAGKNENQKTYYHKVGYWDDRQLNSELRERLRDAQNLRRDWNGGTNVPPRLLDQTIDQLKVLTEANSGSQALTAAALKANVIDPLRQLELELSRQSQAQAGRTNLRLRDEGAAPERYRKAVEEYYRRLSGGGNKPRQ